MYDYSENNYERKRFILNYEIKDNKIILHFATGNDKEIPYNSINEVKVLKQMEKQISNILDLKDKLSDELDDLKMYKIGSIGKFIISLIGILVSIRIYYSMNVIIYLLGLFGSISLLLGIDIIIKDNKIEKTKKKINELEKFEYFFKERHVINSNIIKNKGNKNEFINSKTNNKPVNINNIDKLSLEDLKRIRDMILLEKESNNRKVYVKKR